LAPARYSGDEIGFGESTMRQGVFSVVAFLLVLWCSGGKAWAVVGPGVASLTLSPSTIAGGSGGGATGTVTLGGAAPAGGTVVTLASSNTALAASRPVVVVPAGGTTASFPVVTLLT